jgi:tetratricopeptide (TPR) repeat protein
VTASTGSHVADDEILQDEQQQLQQQQHKEVLDFLAAARQDTKQGRKSAAAGATSGDSAAGVSATADALAAAHTLPVSPAQQKQQQRSSVAQQMEDKRKSCSSISGDSPFTAAAATDGKSAAAWQEQQEQWQQQWQQQQQVWQQHGAQQQQPSDSATDADSQQQVQVEFSLRPHSQPAAGVLEAAAVEHQQQQAQGDEAADTEDRVVMPSGPCEGPSAIGKSPAACQDANSCSAAAAESDDDDFGDFQGSPHATSAGGYFSDSTDAAATEGTAEGVSAEPAAAAAAVTAAAVEQSDRTSLMVHSTATQQHLALAGTAAVEASTPGAGASSAVPANTPEAAAEALLAQGNTAYTAGRYSPAVQCYAKALDSLGGSIAQTTSEAGVLLWIKCSLNLACCHLRLGQFKQCVALCDSLLEGEQQWSRAVAYCCVSPACLCITLRSRLLGI